MSLLMLFGSGGVSTPSPPPPPPPLPPFVPAQPPPRGSSADMLSRLKSLIPGSWFADVAPVRDIVFGGLSDSLAWVYSFIVAVLQQTRIATSTGYFLDLTSLDYLGTFLPRKTGELDNSFRARIVKEILRTRVTRQGMVQAITDLTGTAPTIIEPWNTNDCGGYGTPNIGYGVAGAWGSMQLPAQFFITVTRGTPSGVSGVGGYGNYVGGYGVGAIEYIGPQLATVGITDQDIYNTILATKPTGTIAWVTFKGRSGSPDSLNFESPQNSQYLL